MNILSLKIKNLTGKKFSRWTVIRFSHMDKRRTANWFCRCECGTESIVSGSSLRCGNSKSCGCLVREINSIRLSKLIGEKNPNYKHGLTNTGFSSIYKRYGLRPEQFEALLKEQNNSCAICLISFSGEITPYIDHDHKTNKIRGLLCLSCNLSLGGFKDSISNLENAIKYLKDLKCL